VDTGVVLEPVSSVTQAAQADTAILVQWVYGGNQATGFEIERQTGSGSFEKVATTAPDRRSYTDAFSLTANQTYAYRLRAVADKNASAYVAGSQVSVTFTAPTAVVMTALGDTAQVTWSYSGTSQTGFEIERLVGSGNYTPVGTVTAAVRQFRDPTLLADGGTYTYQVRAIGRNNASDWGRSTQFAASLAAPTNLVVSSLTATQANLQWVDNSNIETGFEIERSSNGTNFTLAGTAGMNASSAMISGNYTSTTVTYSFKVRAKAGTSVGEYSSVVSRSGASIGMIFVQGGTFQMGSTSGDSDEQPAHSVTLSSFYMDAKEVTVAQYRTFCTATGRAFPEAPSWGWQDDNPIVIVSWDSAAAYAEWAGKRLPTEAEWEYAARGGRLSQGYTYSGSNSMGTVAWYISNSGHRTQPVGTKMPNELSIYDMSGNVWEWCSDWYDPAYYSTSPLTNPKGPSSGTNRVLRGGCWDHYEYNCRVSDRYWRNPSFGFGYYGGFRCAGDF
jgi:formylglycine-generating enzyme